jgi:transcriptional regulator NrdR family protein
VNCVECGKFEAYIVESRLRLDGTRYRRYKCQRCSHRWTVYQENERPPRKPQKKLEYSPKADRRRLTNYEAAEILMSDLNTYQLADKYGVTRQSIQKIRNGLHYRDVYLALFPY